MSKQIAPSKKNSRSLFTSVLLGFSVLLTLQFIYQICWVAQRYAWFAEENAPKTYGAIVAVLLGIYIWVKSDRPYQRYLVISVFTTLVVGYIVWIFGETSVGHYLRDANGFWI